MNTNIPNKPDHICRDREGLLKRANDALARQDDKSALVLLKEALEFAPDDILLQQRQAFTLRRLGRHKEALDCLEKIWVKDKRNVSVIMDMAASWRALSDIDRCMNLFQSALDVDDSNKGAWIGLIDCALALSNHDVALRYAETADVKLPGEFVFGLKKAAALKALGRKEEVLAQLQSMLERFPDIIPVRLALALACREVGQFGECMTHYEAILGKEPGNKPAWFGCIDTAIARQQPLLALELVQKASQHLAGDIDLGIKEAFTLQKIGKNRDAISRLEALARAYPDNKTVYLALVSACLLADDHSRYEVYVATLKNLAPADTTSHLRLAAVANAQGHWLAAADHSATVLGVMPQHIEASIIHARSLLGMGDARQAETILTDLLQHPELSPMIETRACMAMAQVQRVKGDTEAAIGYLVRARKANPTDIAVVMELIMLCAAASREHEIGGMLDDLIKLTKLVPNERLTIMLAEYGRLDEALAICRAWHGLYPGLGWIAEMMACLAQLKGKDPPVGSLHPEANPPTVMEELACPAKGRFRNLLDATWQENHDPVELKSGEPASSDPSVYAVAWSHSKVPGLDFSDWKKRADLATRTWMEYDDLLYRDVSELDALNHYLDDDGLSVLEPLARDRRPCFIVSSHMGVPAVVWYLSRKIPQFHYLSGWAAKASEHRKPPFNPLVTSLNNGATIRAIKRLIDEGGMLGSSVDAPFVAFNPQFTSGYSYGTLCGQKFRITNLIPRLAYRFSVPTVWVQPVWKERRIMVEIEEIDVSAGGLSEAEWLNKWTASYLQKLERLIKSGPENLNLRRASAWRYLSAGH
ncbi:hypothetical protein [Kordiimonas aestuarii]|uniref:hypothetical protein n=1 Tax=Kordiimonas aestuarii TaxID=1005925 RepID=UPI0021D1F970|nr:hypothetical protein [Kordiimonas aestuarii]